MGGAVARAREIKLAKFVGWCDTTADAFGWEVIDLHRSNPGQPSLPDRMYQRTGEIFQLKAMTVDTARSKGLSEAQQHFFDLNASCDLETVLATPADMPTLFVRFLPADMRDTPATRQMVKALTAGAEAAEKKRTTRQRRA